MKKIWFIFFLVFLVSCTVIHERKTGEKFLIDKDPQVAALFEKPAVPYPKVKIVVFSDDHFYDPSLGTNGQAFQTYLDGDRKLLAESSQILGSALTDIIKSDAKVVLVSGDLTKDGEKVCHLEVAQALGKLKKSGKQVFVIPGNHDIASGDAARFDGDKKTQIATVTAVDFASIYKDFGYSQALERDPNSLSYVVEPVEGLWILAIDSCRYPENDPVNGHPIVDGKMYRESFRDYAGKKLHRKDRVYAKSLDWIEQRLIEARKKNKAVLVMLHHGIVPHWKGQQKLHWEYLMPGYADLARMFARYDARFVLTGHYHAQDIALKRFKNKWIYDVATGSFVTYPNPWREIVFGPQKVQIRSYFVTSIESHSNDFRTYSRDFTWDGIYKQAAGTLKASGLKDKDIKLIAPQAADAFVANYVGDENPGNRKVPDFHGLSLMGRIALTDPVFGYVLKGLWTDTEPADNNIDIDLRTGIWQKK